MNRMSNGVAAVVIGCATLALPGTARALSCARNSFSAPEDGAEGVPTNTLLWGYGRFEATPPGRLYGPDGEVPLDERSLALFTSAPSGIAVPVLVPRAELQPKTSYRFLMDGAVAEDEVAGPPFVVTFTTGGGPAMAPPPAPELVSVQPRASIELGGVAPFVNRWLALEFDQNEGILIGDDGNTVGSITSFADLLLPTPSASESVLLPGTRAAYWVTTTTSLPVGLSWCIVWPDAGLDSQDARFGVLDLAGNFSGWSATTTLTLPPREEAEANPVARSDRESVALPEGSTGCFFARSRSDHSWLSFLAIALGAGLARGRRSRGST